MDMSAYYDYRSPKLQVGCIYMAINTGPGQKHLRDDVIIIEEDKSLNTTNFLGDDGIWYTENGQGLGITRYLIIQREEVTIYI